MNFSNIRSRAGLVALVFALIISLVSAVPIPISESRLSSTSSPRSNPSLNGQNQIQLDTTATEKIPLKGRMSTLPAASRDLTRRVRYRLSQLLACIYWACLLPSYYSSSFRLKWTIS
jgi:hypothetical protein